MHYQQPDTGNTMNDYFTALADFMRLAPNLLTASTPEDFRGWMELLREIDPRTLILYLRKYRDQLPPEHLAIARERFPKYEI